MRVYGSGVGGRIRAWARMGILVAVLTAAACSPGGRPAEQPAAPGAATADGPKTLRIAMTAEREPKGGVIPIQGSLG